MQLPADHESYSQHMSNNNKHPTGCEVQLAWKCLFTPTSFGGQLWPVK